jgi:hypothetical protein
MLVAAEHAGIALCREHRLTSRAGTEKAIGDQQLPRKKGVRFAHGPIRSE